MRIDRVSAVTRERARARGTNHQVSTEYAATQTMTGRAIHNEMEPNSPTAVTA